MATTPGPDPERLVAFTAGVRQLPLMPALAVDLVRSVQDEQIGSIELGCRIGADAALAAQLLRLVNSPFYGLSRRVGTVGDAVALLGFNLVRRLVAATLTQRPAAELLPDNADTRGFWRHQLLVAALARALHATQAEDGAETAYMAGLLHDTGRLALHAWQPGPDTLPTPSHRVGEEAVVAAERARHGLDHAQAGAALLGAWQLPEAIVHAVGTHADATAPVDPTAASVWQANRLAHLLEADASTAATPPWLGDVGLTPDSLRRLLDEVDAVAGRAR